MVISWKERTLVQYAYGFRFLILYRTMELLLFCQGYFLLIFILKYPVLNMDAKKRLLKLIATHQNTKYVIIRVFIVG